ncbi:hypothetical protein D3C76_970830 [compost metagenome]
MRKTRTIEWASVAGWATENEQQIRDVMKFEGLKGAMVEVLRLAPDQHELAALREELAACESQKSSWAQRAKTLGSQADDLAGRLTNTEQRLADAEQRNAELTKAISDAEYRADQGKVWNGMGWTYTGLHSHGQQKVLDILRAALKPTESGASGMTCNQIREESGLPINNPCTACNNGACIDKNREQANEREN